MCTGRRADIAYNSLARCAASGRWYKVVTQENLLVVTGGSDKHPMNLTAWIERDNATAVEISPFSEPTVMWQKAALHHFWTYIISNIEQQNM